MEHRQLGRSGLFVPVLSLGTGTFGGSNEFFAKWGQTDVQEATRLVDVSLEAGMNFFDTADIYSNGVSEEVLGAAIKGRRDQVLIATKATFASGPGPNEKGSSRHHLVKACEGSLRRLGTDHIDLYFMHGFDAKTPVEETLRALDDLMTAGKIRYIGASNFSGWHVMKSLATSERYGLGRYVSYQGYYSLLHREYEWELMPLALDQGIGTMVWSPLGWGRLTGKVRRGAKLPRGLQRVDRGPHFKRLLLDGIGEGEVLGLPGSVGGVAQDRVELGRDGRHRGGGGRPAGGEGRSAGRVLVAADDGGPQDGLGEVVFQQVERVDVGQHHQAMAQRVCGPLVHEQRPHQFHRVGQRQPVRDLTHHPRQLLAREEHARQKHHGREHQREVVREKVIPLGQRIEDEGNAGEHDAHEQQHRPGQQQLGAVADA